MSEKYKQKVQAILNKNRIENGDVKPTHISYGLFQGKFALDKDQRSLFMKTYINAIEEGAELSILETQKEYGPLLIDIDLELQKDLLKENERLYNDDIIKTLIKNYCKAIEKYYNVSKIDLLASVFEKEKPTIKNEHIVKDGFHIIIPDLCIQTKMRHLIRTEVVKMCDEQNLFDIFSCNADKIIDEAVVSRNSWFLYGSKKPDGQLYELTKMYDMKGRVIYDHKLKTYIDRDTNEINEHQYKKSQLIEHFSISRKFYDKKNSTKLNDEWIGSDIEVEYNKNNINEKLTLESLKDDIPGYRQDEVRKANRLLNILNENRADNYNSWLHLGLALHNIHDSLLVSWIEFSKRSKKFKEGECEKMWRNFKHPTSGNVLTIRSLCHWAKQDNEKEYSNFIKEEFKANMTNSLDGNIYSLAKTVHSKYYDRFVCSNIDRNEWWEFGNHRWNRRDQAYTLKLLLSEDFVNDYNLERLDITLKFQNASGFQKQELIEKGKIIEKIISNLMNTNFKKTLIEECKNMFYDELFEEKLNSNINILGFENGVYDLENSVFRSGRPDDYITFSTKNNYIPWSENNVYYKPIMNFFSQVLPNQKVRNYFINALATCLSGGNKEEKLYVLTGSGSNGKSLTMDLMSHALGNYSMAAPITVITRKRGDSAQASPEILRMKGRRCGIFSEAEDDDSIKAATMKQLTGGDGFLVRDLFKGSNDMVEVKMQMKYFLTCNKLPTVEDRTDGSWRRIRVIDFSSKFTANPSKPNEYMIDNTLKQKIPLWGSALVSYLIHIYNTEYKNMVVLKEPDEVMTSTTQYQKQNDIYTDYINRFLEKTDNTKQYAKICDIWDHFKLWYKDAVDNKKGVKKADFEREIARILGTPLRGNKYQFYKLKLTEDDDEEKPVNELDI